MFVYIIQTRTKMTLNYAMCLHSVLKVVVVGEGGV